MSAPEMIKCPLCQGHFFGDRDSLKHHLIERVTCVGCGAVLTEARVYFGIVGPFCNVACRDRSLKLTGGRS